MIFFRTSFLYEEQKDELPESSNKLVLKNARNLERYAIIRNPKVDPNTMRYI